MKLAIAIILFCTLIVICYSLSSQKKISTPVSLNKIDSSNHSMTGKKFFVDVYHLKPGKLTYADVAKAHAKEIAVEGKYGVHFIKYRVDSTKRSVYCLSFSNDAESILRTHAEAQGLLPDQVYQVIEGPETVANGEEKSFTPLLVFERKPSAVLNLHTNKPKPGNHLLSSRDKMQGYW